MEKLVQRKGESLKVIVPAEVDHCFADEVREEVDRRLQTEDIRVLEFDFKDTEFMDSSGIGLLMGRYKLMRAIGGEVRITHTGERIRKILMLSGIHKIIPIEKEF
ncbi:MAG: STAS domain-containing protein [Lachnospiraceae bacterium]|nr:STAS domain-containing protein [Lachnospiraceae bacterium]MEE1015315.1 STAS domain-containing protein [Lachnospiraceae bacterium]